MNLNDEAGPGEIYDPLASPNFGLGPEDMDLVGDDMDAYASQLESELREEEARRSGDSVQEGSSTGVSARPTHWSPAMSDFDIEEQHILYQDIHMRHPSPLASPALNPAPDDPLFSGASSPQHEDEPGDNGYLSLDEGPEHEEEPGDACRDSIESDAAGYISLDDEPVDASGYLSLNEAVDEPGHLSANDNQPTHAQGYISIDEDDGCDVDPIGYLSMDDDEPRMEAGSQGERDSASDEEPGSPAAVPDADIFVPEVEVVAVQRAVRFQDLERAISISDSDATSPSPPPQGRNNPALRYPVPIPRAALILAEYFASVEEEERIQALVDEYNETYIEILQLSITRRLLERALNHVNTSLHNSRLG